MSEKYSGTLSQETGFRVCVKMKNGHMQAEQRFIFAPFFRGNRYQRSLNDCEKIYFAE